MYSTHFETFNISQKLPNRWCSTLVEPTNFSGNARNQTFGTLNDSKVFKTYDCEVFVPFTVAFSVLNRLSKRMSFEKS